MSGTNNARKLLQKYVQAQYQAFTLNNDAKLIVPQVSFVPGVSASKRKDTFKKTISHPDCAQHIKFISKNEELYSFVWQTRAAQLKKAVRWGIIKTHSITAHVIAALGQYRISAHQRIAKGMISNSQAVKLKLLDLYQDRFEALQDLESLVNKPNTVHEFETVLARYITQLQQINANLEQYFANIHSLCGLDKDTLLQISADLRADIKRTQTWLQEIKSQDNPSPQNRARGHKSIMEFVKQQMIYGLYELQGINQDITFSRQRDFALTRGELNDFIEDARKVINDHQPDARNAVTASHHGCFSNDEQALIAYDFSTDSLNPERERDVLLAISFIEGWDKVDYQSLAVHNASGDESLSLYTATRWKNHRTLTAFFKSLGFYLLNIVSGIFFASKPWDEEAWANERFHLVALELRKQTRSTEPMWQKPVKLFKQIGYAFADLFKGVRNSGSQLIFKMPGNLVNDWDSCNELRPLNEVLTETEQAITAIKTEEQERLHKNLALCGFNFAKRMPPPEISKAATVEYVLNAGEQNDILTAMARGLHQFGSVFSHNLFAKDPIAGLLFSTGFAAGATAIYAPGVATSVLGSAYVNWFSNLSYSLGSSKLAATLAGGSTQGQIIATGLDTCVHGTSGIAYNALRHIGEDPLTNGAYFLTASGIGYLLANGIAGHTIPWLSAFLKEDLGTSPERSYPLVGGKIAILLYQLLFAAKKEPSQNTRLTLELLDKIPLLTSLTTEQQKDVNRFIFAAWLSTHAEELPKLNPNHLFHLSCHIDRVFDKEQSQSLKKLLYPPSSPSIAFQLFFIPLSYIPALTRCLISPFLSIAALVNGKSNPVAPMKRSTIKLLDKIKSDLSRILVVASYLTSLAHMIILTPLRALAYTVAMLIGRVADDVKPAHAIHRAFAFIHNVFRSLGEFIYPARAIKDLASAHPAHTLKQVEHSYVRLLAQMDNEKTPTKAVNPYDYQPDAAVFSFETEPKTVTPDDKLLAQQLS